jgi:hypothetical protein
MFCGISPASSLAAKMACAAMAATTFFHSASVNGLTSIRTW